MGIDRYTPRVFTDPTSCRCGVVLESWELYDHQYDACSLVFCDSLDCRAKNHPQDIDDYAAAVEHWQHHKYLSGCSHAR